jgi:hypothetical protein
VVGQSGHTNQGKGGYVGAEQGHEEHEFFSSSASRIRLFASSVLLNWFVSLMSLSQYTHSLDPLRLILILIKKSLLLSASFASR